MPVWELEPFEIFQDVHFSCKIFFLLQRTSFRLYSSCCGSVMLNDSFCRFQMMLMFQAVLYRLYIQSFNYVANKNESNCFQSHFLGDFFHQKDVI
jgi:hypothetical protein